MNLPNSLTSIGFRAFLGCENLSTVILPDNITSTGYNSFENCSRLTTVVLPNTITAIESGAFQGCISLSSIEIPESVTFIGSEAFKGCKELSSIIIPDNVKTIQWQVFEKCSKLKTISIGRGIQSIAGSAFGLCPEINEVYCYARAIPTVTDDIFKDSYIEYATLHVRKSLIEKYKEKEPWGNFKNIIGIDDYQDGGNYNEEIWWSYIEDEHKLTFGGKGTIPSYDISPWSTYLKEVEFIKIEDGIESIGYQSFMGSSLTSVDIPNSVTNISSYSFYGCSNLKSINLPNSVVSIGSFSFEMCTGLTTVIIPDNVTTIGRYAFMYCTGLTSITIGKSVSNIESQAFAFLTEKKLKDVFCYAPIIKQYNNNIFESSFINEAVLHVPTSSIDIYNASPVWRDFKEIVKISMPKHLITYIVDGKLYKSYEIEEGETIIPEKYPSKEGYSFSGWSDIPETMPTNDVTVTGTFSVNKYKLTYTVDGGEYKSTEVEYGSTITPEADPAKEGYTFSGWSEIPSTMPANDVTITGGYTINKYKLTYIVDGELYDSYNVEYGTTITPETEPTKEGYTFSGWSEIPETMPANEVYVVGKFTINKYKITYVIDGVVFKTEEVEYGSTITPPNPGNHEGYDFAWEDYPTTMPAEDILIYGTYTATGIEAILASEPDVKIFTVSGKPLNKLQKGVNILRYKDGRTRKIVVK